MTVARTRLALSDLVREAYLSLVARPARALLTAAGTIISIGALVAVLGLAGTANGQVSASFDALQATTVTGADVRKEDGEALPFPFTPEALRRARHLNGVTAVGALYSPITADSVVGPNPSVRNPQTLPLLAVSSGLWEVLEVKDFRGRLTDDGLADAAVAVLGAGAAEALGIQGLAHPTTIEIGGRPFTVIGIVDEMERRQEIALRRALGATKLDIAAQIALESALLGAVGGLAGATLGMYTVIGIALARDWSPIVNLELVVAAPLVGALTGVVAGLYPAYRAASFEPAHALRAG